MKMSIPKAVLILVLVVLAVGTYAVAKTYQHAPKYVPQVQAVPNVTPDAPQAPQTIKSPINDTKVAPLYPTDELHHQLSREEISAYYTGRIRADIDRETVSEQLTKHTDTPDEYKAFVKAETEGFSRACNNDNMKQENSYCHSLFDNAAQITADFSAAK